MFYILACALIMLCPSFLLGMDNTAALTTQNSCSATENSLYGAVACVISNLFRNKADSTLLVQSNRPQGKDSQKLIKKRDAEQKQIASLELFNVVRKGNAKDLTALIQSGADLTTRESAAQWGLLHVAALLGKDDMIKTLIAAGVHISAKTHDKLTPLALASGNSTMHTVELLLNRGAHTDINTQSVWGETPLHRAAYRGDKNVIELLLDWGARMDTQDSSGDTALHIAAERGNLEAVTILLNRSTNPSNMLKAKNNEQNTPIDVAIKNEKKEVVIAFYIFQFKDEAKKLAHKRECSWSRYTNDSCADVIYDNDFEWDRCIIILKKALQFTDRQHLANLLQEIPEFDCSAKDERKDTLLHTAAWRGDSDVVELLIEAGADLHFGEITPLQTSLKSDQVEAMKALLVKDTAINLDVLLHYALERNSYNYNCPKELIDRGANIEAKNANQETPLVVAIRARNFRAASLLIEKGANLDVKSKEHETLLLLAVRVNSHGDIVQLLIEKGQNVNAQVTISEDRFIRKAENMTPLHWAAYNDNGFLLDLLIKNGADINAKLGTYRNLLFTWNGFTPLDIAILKLNEEAYDLLKNKGAKTNVYNENNNSISLSRESREAKMRDMNTKQ